MDGGYGPMMCCKMVLEKIGMSDQSRHYIKIMCEAYLHKMSATQGWLDMPTSNQPIPLPAVKP